MAYSSKCETAVLEIQPRTPNTTPLPKRASSMAAVALCENKKKY